MEKPIVTALCAYGMSGRVFHGPLLEHHPQFFLSKVWERSKKQVSSHFPSVVSVDSYNELLEDKEIELVVVNTPEHSHFELAKMALEAGKHVLVEKAFTVHSREAEELTTLARSKSLVLSVFHNRRWDSGFLTVRKVIQSGLLGRIRSYEAHFDRYRPWIRPDSWKEAGGPGTGNLYNLGSHLIDQALCLFGAPEAVFADIRQEREGSHMDDAFTLQLYYPRHLRATLCSSYLVREAGPRFELHGDRGSFVKYGDDPQEAALKEGQLPDAPQWGHEPEDEQGILHTEENGMVFRGKVESVPGSYPDFYTGLYLAIRERTDPPVTAEAGVTVIRVIEAAYRSAAEKRIVELEN